MLAILGLGPFSAEGPIMDALAGLGVGCAVGGLIGALVGLGIPEYEAKQHEGRIKEGRSPAFRSLRYVRADHACEGRSKADGCRRCLFCRRSQRRLGNHGVLEALRTYLRAHQRVLGVLIQLQQRLCQAESARYRVTSSSNKGLVLTQFETRTMICSKEDYDEGCLVIAADNNLFVGELWHTHSHFADL
jgi:hypothetical protein